MIDSIDRRAPYINSLLPVSDDSECGSNLLPRWRGGQLFPLWKELNDGVRLGILSGLSSLEGSTPFSCPIILDKE